MLGLKPTPDPLEPGLEAPKENLSHEKEPLGPVPNVERLFKPSSSPKGFAFMVTECWGIVDTLEKLDSVPAESTSTDPEIPVAKSSVDDLPRVTSRLSGSGLVESGVVLVALIERFLNDLSVGVFGNTSLG